MGKKRVLVAWALVLPALLVRGATIIYPMITTAWYSLLNYKMITQTKKFVGFQKLCKAVERSRCAGIYSVYSDLYYYFRYINYDVGHNAGFSFKRKIQREKIFAFHSSDTMGDAYDRHWYSSTMGV